MSDASTTSLRRTMLRFVLPTIIAALPCDVAGTARAQNDANPEHIVVAEGVCKYRIVNPNFFDCRPFGNAYAVSESSGRLYFPQGKAYMDFLRHRKATGCRGLLHQH